MKSEITPEQKNREIVEKAILKNNLKLGQSIQKEMNAQGMFPKHICRSTGIQRTHLDSILEGKQVITIPTLIKICVALKIKLHLDCTNKNGEIVTSFISNNHEITTTNKIS